MPSQIAGSPPEDLPEPTGGTFHRAGPSQPRRRGERRVRSRAPDTLVDAALHAIADAGSIPAVSTPTVRRFGLQRRPGRLSRSAAVHRPAPPAPVAGAAGAPYDERTMNASAQRRRAAYRPRTLGRAFWWAG